MSDDLAALMREHIDRSTRRAHQSIDTMADKATSALDRAEADGPMAAGWIDDVGDIYREALDLLGDVTSSFIDVVRSAGRSS